MGVGPDYDGRNHHLFHSELDLFDDLDMLQHELNILLENYMKEILLEKYMKETKKTRNIHDKIDKLIFDILMLTAKNEERSKAISNYVNRNRKGG